MFIFNSIASLKGKTVANEAQKIRIEFMRKQSFQNMPLFTLKNFNKDDDSVISRYSQEN